MKVETLYENHEATRATGNGVKNGLRDDCLVRKMLGVTLFYDGAKAIVVSSFSLAYLWLGGLNFSNSRYQAHNANSCNKCRTNPYFYLFFFIFHYLIIPIFILCYQIYSTKNVAKSRD